jgi:hypothetical protein
VQDVVVPCNQGSFLGHSSPLPTGPRPPMEWLEGGPTGARPAASIPGQEEGLLSDEGYGTGRRSVALFSRGSMVRLCVRARAIKCDLLPLV